MTTTADNVLELARAMVWLDEEVDRLRRRVDALEQLRDGVDPEQLAEVVAARLGSELGAVRRAQRLAGRRVPR